MRSCRAKAGLDHSAVLLLHLLSLSSTESSAREISSMRNTPPSFMASTRGPSCHWNSLPSSPADCTDKNDYTFSCTVLEGNQHGGAASRYLMCVSDGSEASQEVGRLHVQVAVDREEPVTGQRGKQLADCRLSTAAREEAGGASASFHLHGGQIQAERECRDSPGVSDQQHRLAEAKRPSHQHRQPPHGLSPHHVAELLRDAGDAVDQGTWRAEGRN